MSHPFLDPSFHVRWSTFRPEFIKPDIEEALRRGEERIAAIKKQPAEGATFTSTFLALEDATEGLAQAWGYVSHLDSVSNSPELREAFNEMLPKVTAFYARLPLEPELWGLLKAVAGSPEIKTLGKPHQRLVEETVAAFRRSGSDLSPEQKLRIEVIQQSLAEKTQKFAENDLDSTNAYELLIDDPTRLEGLPESAREAARESALKKGHGTEEAPVFRFTLQAPSLMPALQYLKEGSLRRELWEAASAIGHKPPHDNTEILREILRLRAEKAQLLGYTHFPDFVLERRMAKTGAAALAFVENLYEKTKPVFDAENAELEAYRTEKTGESGPLAPWDQAYWAERLRRERFDLDEEELRPYFPLNQVLRGLFTICERVFSIRVNERIADKPEVWDPDVQFFDVYDAQSDRHLGSFYTDWFPRETKRGGAWMNPLLHGQSDAPDARTPHLGLMAGNMSPPVGKTPALLTHREVETVFHEFGHLLHHILGDVPVKSLNGTNVAWDWVELPSQIMENWCWERSALDLFARHHKTGEPLPEDLFEKMLSARTFHAARAQMRQLSLAKIDLELHHNPTHFLEGNLDAALREVLEGYLAPSPIPAISIARRFTHLFGSSTGYAAGYYSYKWSEVLDADAFSRFRNEGILSPEVGADFRRHILSQGNAEDPAVLYRRFMGRDPNPEALLERLGLLS